MKDQGLAYTSGRGSAIDGSRRSDRASTGGQRFSLLALFLLKQEVAVLSETHLAEAAYKEERCRLVH